MSHWDVRHLQRRARKARCAGMFGETWSMRQGRLNAEKRRKILEPETSKPVRTLTPEQRAAKNERDRARRAKQKEASHGIT